MAIKVYGDKIVYPDNSEQKTAFTGAVDAYTKDEIDEQQEAQDVKIDKNATDLTNVYTKTEVDDSQSAQDTEIAKKIGDAPSNGKQYARQDSVWAELASADGGITDAPVDGKTYGRKDLKWEEVTSDAYTESETDTLLNDKADKATTYTKTEVDASQSAQDTKIDKNTADIVLNKADIAKNTSDIEDLAEDIDALTGSVIYKGSLNATVVEAPAEANVGDMYINEYNVDEPSTNYPVASGWTPVVEVKFDDKLIKTDAGWDKIESVVGIPTYTAGEIDVLLDDKADKDTVYTKTETDTLLDSKADEGDSYLKDETYSNTEIDGKLFEKADTDTTYTKEEVDDAQDLQDAEIAKKADKETIYTKEEVDELLESASGSIVANYTNKWASSVARDPEVGNLYLVYGMTFSSKYEEVTKIYISDTDGDGRLRDFDEVNVDDKLTLTSESGTGEYTIVTVSDVSGYRELVVSIDASAGTIANDSAVSIVLDVASSGGESSGVEEAPADGKQYARKDKTWTEVEASGTGGGAKAEPPVVMSCRLSVNFPVTTTDSFVIPFTAIYSDTNNGIKDNAYIVPEDGFYNINAHVRYICNEDLRFVQTRLMIDDSVADSSSSSLSASTPNSYQDGTVATVRFLTKGQKVHVEGLASALSGTLKVHDGYLSLSQVSSITEGEVKEKEAVTVRASMSKEFDLLPNTFTKVWFDTSSWSDKDNFDTTNYWYIPKVEGYYQVNCGVGLSDSNVGYLVRVILNDDEAFRGNHHSSGILGAGGGASASGVIYCNGVDDKIFVETWSEKAAEVVKSHRRTFFDAHLITGQSSGGDYTPEKMVWEEYPIGSDPVTERTWDTDYRNTNDVPLYVKITRYSQASEDYYRFILDGKEVGIVGTGPVGTSKDYNTNLFIIPSGSTYRVRFSPNALTHPEGNKGIRIWNEARMPVAVGTGGKTVAFKGGISANQTVTSATWTKVNLDKASTDTDNALIDGKFKPSVAGWYQVNGAVHQQCSPVSISTSSSLYKNGGKVTVGSNVNSQTNSNSSQVSDIIYLNGTTDYLELYGSVSSTGTCAIEGQSIYTYLSAVLVSGGSGDSIWTEEDGKAVYDGNVGIGTDSPSNAYKLTLTGATTGVVGGVLLEDTSESKSYGIYTASSNLIIRDLTSKTERMRIDTEGNVGIGTSGNPTETLHVVGNIRSVGSLKSNNSAEIIGTASAGSRLYANAPTGGYLELSGSPDFVGNFHAGMRVIRDTASGYSSALTFYTEKKSTADKIDTSTEKMKIDSNGRVDITGSLYVNGSPITTSYSAEEVDKKLAIKDKLIEKLSARLDKLEKRVK